MGCCASNENTMERQALVGQRVSGNEFGMPYMFKQRKTVILQHNGGNHLRVEMTGHGLLGTGGKGKFSRFEAIPENNGNRIKLKSLHNGKFLRIHYDRKNVLDCGGKGGKLCLFKVIRQGTTGDVKLESVHC